MGMNIYFGAFAFLAWLGLSANVYAGPQPIADAIGFAEEDTTTYYRAVYAQYLTVIADPNLEDGDQTVDCGLSISNLCAAPGAVLPLLAAQGGPTAGRLTLFLYGSDGEQIIYTPTSDDLGEGLNPDGTLSEGGTWRVRLAQILADHSGDGDESKINFSGYGWVLSEFDCLGGTYNNTVFGVGFTQAFEFLPAMGQGGWFGGVPIFGLEAASVEALLGRAKFH
jgi:hypothetical protein